MIVHNHLFRSVTLAALFALGASVAQAGPFAIRGTQSGVPVTVDDGFSNGINGDFAPANDVITFLFRNEVTYSGTGFSPDEAGGLPFLALTGAPVTPPPAFFDPAGMFPAAMYGYSFGGADSITTSDTWTMPSGFYNLKTTVAGTAYFPSNVGLVNVAVTSTLGSLTTFTSFNVVNPGNPGYVPFGVVSAIAGPDGGGLTLQLVQLDLHFFDGPAAIYFPGSIEAEVTAVPEPASLTLLGLGVAGLLGYRARRRGEEPE